MSTGRNTITTRVNTYIQELTPTLEKQRDKDLAKKRDLSRLANSFNDAAPPQHDTTHKAESEAMARGAGKGHDPEACPACGACLRCGRACCHGEVEQGKPKQTSSTKTHWLDPILSIVRRSGVKDGVKLFGFKLQPSFVKAQASSFLVLLFSIGVQQTTAT